MNLKVVYYIKKYNQSVKISINMNFKLIISIKNWVIKPRCM